MSRLHFDDGGTDEGTTLKSDELIPCRLPELLINSSSHETSQHHRIPLFDVTELHGLSSSAKNFRSLKNSISMLSSRIDGTTETKSVTRSRFWRLETRSPKTARSLDEKGGSKYLMQYALSLKSKPRPVQDTPCIVCRMRQTFLGLTFCDSCASCDDNSQRAQSDVRSTS